ncbi:MAG TPA: hypothetical protein VGF92_07375 [Stellaceae bacterium]
MAFKANVGATSMPLDNTGAPAPRPLTQWIEHLKRGRAAAKKARAVTKRRRAITQQRVAKAEGLLADIINSADIIGHGVAAGQYFDYPVVHLLVTLHHAAFNELAIFGAEFEDSEDSHDAEPTEADEGELTLGRTERVAQPEERGTDDAEPSSGATQMVDQRRWHEGPVTDLELDRADHEASVGADTLEFDACDLGEQREYPATPDEAIIEEARSRYAAATGNKVVALPARDPVTGKAGVWLLQRRAGGAK